MKVPLIYIAGLQYDVSSETVIALTVQAFNFSTALNSVKANYTNRITLPLTAGNKLKLEMIAPLNVITTKPYATQAIRIVQDGFEIIPNGVCQIVEVQNTIVLDVQSGAKGFVDAITNRYLTEIDTSDVDVTWGKAAADTNRANTTGLCAPVVDYGFRLNDSTIDVLNNNVSFVNDLATNAANAVVRPVLGLDYIIGKIIGLAGFKTKAGTLLSDANYSAMGVPVGLLQDSDWLKRKEGKVRLDVTGPINNGVNTQLNILSVISGNQDGFWDPATERYLVSGAINNFDVKVRGIIYMTNTGTANVGSLLVNRNGVGVATSINAIAGGAVVAYGFETTATNLLMQNGSTITLKINPGGAGTVTIVDGWMEVITVASTDTFLPASVSGGYTAFSKLLNRMLITDFLKTVFQIFDVVIKEKNGTIYFNTLESIINDPAPIDWSNKIAPDEVPKVNFSTPFAQSNIVQWNNPLVGNSTFGIANTTLTPSTTIINSVAQPSEEYQAQEIYSGIKCAKIPVFGPLSGVGDESTVQQALNIKLRFILMRAKAGPEPAVSYNGTGRSDYKVGYFMDTSQAFYLHWAKILSTYYKSHQRILNSWKSVSMLMSLTSLDVYAFDSFKPIHIKGQKYLVEKINEFIPGKSVKVDFIKI